MSLQIIRRFGGARALAHAIGVPESTVRGWYHGIPRKYMQRVLDAGQALKPRLRPEDFFEKEVVDAAPQKERNRSAAAD